MAASTGERSAAFSVVRNYLLGSIVDGRGDKAIFDEFSLSRRFETPRSVVRTALTSLVESQLVYRMRHHGTSPRQSLNQFEVGEGVLRLPTAGSRAVFRTDRWVRLPAPASIAADLGVAEGAPVTVLNRTTEVDGSADEHWTVWTALDLRATFGEEGVPQDLNWYEVLHRVTGEQRFRTERWMTGFRAAEGDGSVLDVEPGTPLLFLSRLTRRLDGTPLDRSFGSAAAERSVLRDLVEVHVGGNPADPACPDPAGRAQIAE